MKDPAKHMIVEEDVGSGEKTPGQEDTDKIIDQVGKKKPGAGNGVDPARERTKSKEASKERKD